MKNKVFLICYDFLKITASGIHAFQIIKKFKNNCHIEVLTSGENIDTNTIESVSVHSIENWYPKKLIDLTIKFRLGKLIECLFPFSGEPAFFWIVPAVLKALELIKERKPDVIVIWMMPYSVGIIGIIIKWFTGIPLVFNFGDSPTCTDMSGNVFPTILHYHMSKWMEDFYIHKSDAVIYVSQKNLDRVKNRQPQKEHLKFNLVRCGANPEDCTKVSQRKDNCFEITYVGGMAGWFEFYSNPEKDTFIRKIYQAWLNLGRYEVIKLDIRSSSPIFIGKAVQQILVEHCEWRDRIKINVYGNEYPDYVIERVLKNQELTKIISVYPPVPNIKAIDLACQSDLLFLTLPARPAGSGPGGRISVKTYEYLMTERPILAAVSQGENWDYLEGKPGVWLVEPTDICAMKQAISEIANAKFLGKDMTFDRTAFRPELSYEQRAKELHAVLQRVLRS